MTKPMIVAVTALVVALAPATAASGHGKSKHRTTNYKTSLTPAGADGVYAGITGRAKLQDHKRKDRLWVKLRNVKPGAVYTAKLFKGACSARGAEVTGWTVKNAIDANADGNASGRLDNKTFEADRTSPYAVVVYTPEGLELACGTFKAKVKKAKKGKGHSKSKKNSARQPRPTNAQGPRTS